MGEPEAADANAGAVVVAYVHQHDVSYAWHHSMIELLGWDITHEGRMMRGGFVSMKCASYAEALTDARNKAVRAFLTERQAEWLFWIDTDMGFMPDTIDRLMAEADPAERPVVGGLCFTQREESPDGYGGWRVRATPTVFDWLTLPDGQMGFNVRWNYPPDALTRVAGTGSACVLIHRSVFERVQERFGPIWYGQVPNTSTGQVVSEDLSFALRCGALDIPIHVHTGVRTTHAKRVWVSEDVYFGERMLAQIMPDVPPATEPTAVIVPTLWRPKSAQRFMDSMAESGALPLAHVYAIIDTDDTESVAAWIAAGADVLTRTPDGHPGTFAERCNFGYQHTTEPWLLLVGDDVEFRPGWLNHAQYAARDGADVVGTNDLHNPRVVAGEHATHMMVRRAYVDEVGGGWDGPGVLAHEGYHHWFVDDEIVTAAKQRGGWVSAQWAQIEHHHPMWGGAEDDATYQRTRESVDADRELYQQRLAASLA